MYYFDMNKDNDDNNNNNNNNDDDDNARQKSSREEDLANSLVLLSNGSCLKPFAMVMKGSYPLHNDPNVDDRLVEKPLLEKLAMQDNSDQVVRGTFECRACNKVFYSHQALGGHRASHKKIKGCFASAFTSHDEKRVDVGGGGHRKSILPSTPIDENARRHSSSEYILTKRKQKSHKCSICHRAFPSGQALGGHKRCHWLPTSTSNTTSFYISSFHNFLDDEGLALYKKAKFIDTPNPKPLDLNQIPSLFTDKVDVRLGSHTSGLGTSMTADYLGQEGIRRDIYMYQSPLQHKSTQNHCTLKRNISKGDSGRIMSTQLRHLKDNNLDGQFSHHWLQLGIGSTSKEGGM